MESEHKCCKKQKVKRGLWSHEEDQKLFNYVSRHGIDSCWSSISRLAGLQRCGKSCRLRWLNCLRPGLRRGNISAEEANLIVDLHQKIGNKWATIAKHFPGRSDNEIKNYWYTNVKKKHTSDSHVHADLSQFLPTTTVPDPNASVCHPRLFCNSQKISTRKTDNPTYMDKALGHLQSQAFHNSIQSNPNPIIPSSTHCNLGQQPSKNKFSVAPCPSLSSSSTNHLHGNLHNGHYPSECGLPSLIESPMTSTSTCPWISSTSFGDPLLSPPHNFVMSNSIFGEDNGCNNYFDDLMQADINKLFDINPSQAVGLTEDPVFSSKVCVTTDKTKDDAGAVIMLTTLQD